MKKYILLFLFLFVINYTYAAAENSLQLSIVASDKGCPSCRFSLFRAIIDRMIVDKFDIKMRIIFNTNNEKLIKDAGELFKFKEPVELITGERASVLFKYNMPEDVGDTYIFIEDDKDDMVCIPNVNATYRDNETPYKDIKKVALTLTPHLTLKSAGNAAETGIIRQIKKLDKDKFSLSDLSQRTYIVDTQSDTVAQIFFPDSIYYRYLTAEEKMNQSIA